MNMITFSARDRARIVTLHTRIASAVEAQDGQAVSEGLTALEQETQKLYTSLFSNKS